MRRRILQTVLVVASPVVVLLGASTMLYRTYRVWKRNGRWVAVWQAAWFLLFFFIVMLFNSAPVPLRMTRAGSPGACSPRWTP